MTPSGLAVVWHTCHAKARAGGLPVWRQCLEMTVLFACRRMGPGYYLLARFWRREVPFRDKWRHCHDREYARHVVALNPSRYQKVSQHKVAEKAVLSLFGLPTPRFIGFFHGRRGLDAQARPLRNAGDLERSLQAQVGRQVCFKTVEGYGGSDFIALLVGPGPGALRLRHPLTGEQHTVPSWCERLEQSADGWILEEFLEQHPVLAAMNASSVNTLRLWVLADNGEFRTRGAFLRVGRAGSQVDNTSRGGLACPIDLTSGRIVEALDLTPGRQRHAVHPDSRAPLVGVEIPHWRECLRVAGAALAVFPHMRFAGLDMAVTEQGPSVIELNVDPDRRGLAHLDLPHRDLFDGRRPPGRTG
jgi:hypothetical protein